MNNENNELLNPTDWRWHYNYTLIEVPGTEDFWFYK